MSLVLRTSFPIEGRRDGYSVLLWFCHATHRDLYYSIIGHVFLDTCLVAALVKDWNLVLNVYDFHRDCRGCQTIIRGSIPRSYYEFVFLRNLCEFCILLRRTNAKLGGRPIDFNLILGFKRISE